jgi:hypothetical protein
VAQPSLRGPVWIGVGVALVVIGVFVLLDGATGVGAAMLVLGVVIFGLGFFWFTRSRIDSLRRGPDS